VAKDERRVAIVAGLRTPFAKQATELRGLVSDIRKDPQKYLRVKVSIF